MRAQVLIGAIRDSCSAGASRARHRQPIPEELTILREYSAALVHKLEKRNTELEEAQATLAAMNEKLEQRVRERTAQLESSNEELEAFSYSVSHDLRAPLRHLNGFVGLLRQNTAALDGESQQFLKMISQAAKQMAHLIDHLLEFSRLGRTQLVRRRLDVNDLVRMTLKDLEAETKGRNITWQIATLPEVEADPTLLRQVWTNLLSNAVKYTRKRDSAEIEIGTLAQESGEPAFFVRDKGAGFDMQYAPKLFGVFQRLHTNEEFEGTGIGLANVRRIVCRHGGRAWAEGKIDTGATFYFTLPKDIPESNTPSAPLRRGDSTAASASAHPGGSIGGC